MTNQCKVWQTDRQTDRQTNKLTYLTARQHYRRDVFLSAATKLGQGNVFTGVCLSTGGVLPQCKLGYHHHPPGADPPWDQASPRHQTDSPGPGRHHPPWPGRPPGPGRPPPDQADTECLPWRLQVPTTILWGAAQVQVNVPNYAWSCQLCTTLMNLGEMDCSAPWFKFSWKLNLGRSAWNSQGTCPWPRTTFTEDGKSLALSSKEQARHE